MLNLSCVVNAFSKISEDVDVYLNKNTGKSIVIYGNDKFSQNAFNEIETNFDSYLLLPNCHGINAKAIMARYVETIDNDSIKYEFISALNSDKPCAKFMDTLFHFGLRDSWNEFKYNEMIDLSIRFMNYYQIDYIDDITVPKKSFTIEVIKTIKKEYKIKADSKEDALNELNELLEKDDLNSYEFVKVEKIVK
ncbi:MAG: UPF0158 family protein [bacterium]|nr:UPF0158 family protein [bacterium]